jgi:AcrR family transcriptional regulator
MSARAAAAEATRDRVVDAACAAFETSWYDDVTLRGVAGAAGVALQTVVNHFGTKEALFAAAAERSSERIPSGRWEAEPGDVESALQILVDDYERHGDMFIRSLAVEGRVPVVGPTLERGRREHREWVEHVFAAALRGLPSGTRERRLDQLVVATDVYTWKILRRDQGRDRHHTLSAMCELVHALHR